MLFVVIIYFILLVMEFLTLLFGVSVMYKKVNSVQLLLHGLGVFFGIWMLLDGWHWYSCGLMAFLFGLIPVILELSVLFSFKRFSDINTHIKNQQLNEIERIKVLKEQRQKEEKERVEAE